AVGRDGAASAPPGGRPGSDLALDPAFGGVGATLRGEHAGAAQAQLPLGDLILVLLAGGLVPELEALVVALVGQQIVGTDVLGIQSLRPGLPVGGKVRVIAGPLRGIVL